MYSSDINEFPLSSPTALMTPNTIKTIEQSILASLEGTTSNPQIIASAATGSFVPPLPNPNLNYSSSQNIILTSKTNGGSIWQGNNIKLENNSSSVTNTTDEDFSDDEEEVYKKKTLNKNKNIKRKMGGRRPKRVPGNPEEEERRKIRRERNKLAAARCRKRRVDHTNLLLEETEELESKRRNLQELIEKTQQEKEELEFVLEAHLPNCKKSLKEINKPIRPTSLLVSSPQQQQQNQKNMLSISTPSNGLNIGFENIDWTELPTGLTPIVTSVVNGINNLSTPLVTPSTANAILNSLNNHNKFVNL